MLHIKFAYDWPSNSWKDARRTADDDGRQPIAIGHLSDSGDRKKVQSSYLKTITDYE